MTIHQDARALPGRLTKLRHDLHARPEIGLDLPRTQAAVLRSLEDLSLETTLGRRSTSVVAVLCERAPGREPER